MQRIALAFAYLRAAPGPHAHAAVAERRVRTAGASAFPGPPLKPVGEDPFGQSGGALPFVQRLENRENVQYTVDIKIGGQTVSGLYDTGSFELLVISKRCEVCRGAHYDPRESATYIAESDEIVLHEFGSGPTHSRLGLEHVEVGPLVAWNVSFYEVINHDIPPLDGGTFDAIVGVAPGSGPEDVSLSTQFNVTAYSICLERGSLAPGWFTWGLQPTSVPGLRLSVVGEHHWAVSLTAFRPAVNHTAETRAAAEMLLCGNGCAAVLDSGTSLIAAPSIALQGLSFVLPPLAEDCSNFNELPVLELELDGNLFRLPPEAYVLRIKGTVVEAQSVWDVLYFKPKLQVVDQCFYAFMPLDAATKFGPLWILGMPFFRQFHTTYEFAGNRSVVLRAAGEDCAPEPLANVTEDYADVGQSNYPFPDMVVTQTARREQTRARAPLTVSAASLRLPARWKHAHVDL